MKIVRGEDFWRYPACYRCITTNGVVRRDGTAVMGKGIALEAARRYPSLPKLLGDLLRERGNHVHLLDKDAGLISFPTKHDWRNPSDIGLIARSCRELLQLVGGDEVVVLLPPPGCSNGRLDWERDVRPVVASILVGDRFVVVL